MYKQSPRRGHRSKGIKVKHILQICLLLAVCFWLAYQVKHSQDKRKEFVGKDGTDVDKQQTGSEVLRFGRKDLPRVTEIATEEKHEEDDEGNEAEEENNKPEEDETKLEDDDNKHEEEEEESEGDEKNEEREGGDDDTDENNPDKREVEHEGEEQVDEDKDTDDNDGDAKQSHTEDEENEDTGKENRDEDEENNNAGKEGGSELVESHGDTNDQNNDEDSAGTHEAREELYKADDASSEVAHNVQTVNSNTENVTMDQANGMFGKVNLGQENETITSISADALKTDSQPLLVKDEVSNGTVIEQKTPENNLNVSDDGSLQNSTSATLPNNLPELNSNYTSLDGEHRTLSENAVDTTGHQNPNLLNTVLDEVNKPKLSADEKNLSEDSVNSTKTENAYTNAGDSLSSNDTTLASSQKPDKTSVTEAVKNSFVGDETQDKKSENNNTTVSDETSSSHSDDENEGAIEQDPIDVSDTSITDEDKESRIDLDTLPKTETEVHNTHEAMAD